MRKYPSAIVAFEKAGNEAVLFEDYLYSGLSERNKATIFGIMGNNTAAMESQKKAISFFEKVPNKSYLQYATLGLAIIYINDKQRSEAQKLLDWVQKNTSDTNLLEQCHQFEAVVLAEDDKDPSAVIRLYNSVPAYHLDIIDYGLRAIAYQKLGMRDSSDYWLAAGYLQSDNEAKKATLDFLKSKIEVMRHDYLSAYHLVSQATHVQDSITRLRLQESASSAQRDYYSQELMLQRQRLKTRTVLFQSGVAILVIMIAAITLIFILLSRQKDEKYREALASLHSNEDALRQLSKDNAELLGSLLAEKLLYLDKLSLEYCNADSEKAKEAVFKQYKATVRQLRDDPGLFDEIEQSLDKYCNGIVTKFKSQFPDFKGDKLRMAILFFTGAPYKTIDMLLRGHSVDSLKMAKGRFRKMIQESGAEDTQLFLDMLEMKKGGRRKNG